jgi:hypothetical protein
VFSSHKRRESYLRTEEHPPYMPDRTLPDDGKLQLRADAWSGVVYIAF